MALGERVLWDGLDLRVAAGEFIAVLGPNGSGKTTLLKVLLGQRELTAGTVRIDGRAPGGAGAGVAYIPQQQAMDADVPLRARDLVGLGLDGHRLGLGLGQRFGAGAGARFGGTGARAGGRSRRAVVDAALAAVGATAYANAPVGRLSGGEQQRLRVAQALVGDPSVLLCDEPLLSLDLANQRVVSQLIDARRTEAATAVLFVTHEINPVLPLVDRVLYLVNGQFRVGTPDEVMTSEVLSELYRTRVDVLRVRDRLVVVGTEDSTADGADGTDESGGWEHHR
ncbi:MAG TPA: ATP-binding cassette domain-containing protein [Pseudonocardia sp.]|nr:ATP-binding cassette domain-containing protein [Pseudonocardia sp.]